MSTVPPVQPFASLRGQSNLIKVLFIILAVVTVVSIVSDIAQANLLQRIADGLRVSSAEADANDLRVGAIGMVWLAIWLAASIGFLVWIHRANRNLGGLGAADKTITPGWAVGWFFVPILSLWKPYQAMKEVWQGSDPTGVRQSPGFWKALPVPGILGIWWALFIVSNIIGNLVLRITLVGDDAATLLVGTYAGIVSSFLDLIGIFLVTSIVSRVSRMQEEKAVLLSQTSAAPAM